jgi:hypothetical protein
MAHHVLVNLQRQVNAMGDPTLIALEDELRAYVAGVDLHEDEGDHGLAVTMELERGDQVLRFVNLIATFGSAVDATTSELMIETFLPADDATEEVLRAL